MQRGKGMPGWVGQGDNFNLVFDGLGKLKYMRCAVMDMGDEHKMVKL